MAARMPLDDVVVLDFSRVLAGPFATMLLADHGATVVKVERRGSGDDTRAWGPPFASDGTATYYLSVNRGKRSVALDLGSPEDLAAARALAAEADVVVENFRPGVMERFGLGWEQLSAADPRLIYCSITGFGAGPGAAMPGYDLLVQAVGGLMSVTGSPDGEPQKVGVALVDVLTGLFAVNGILTALRHRDRVAAAGGAGGGQRIELDLLSCLLASLVNQASGYTAGGVVPGRMGNAHPSIAPYELFATGGGPLVLAVGTDRQFAALCEVLQVASLATDPRFVSNEARVAHRHELKAALEQALATAPAAAWAERLLAAGVPAGEVNDVAGAFALAARLGLDPIAELAPAAVAPDGTARAGAAQAAAPVRLPRNPVRLSATPPRRPTAPPALGDTSVAEALSLLRQRSLRVQDLY